MIKLILKYYPRLYGAVIENIYQIEIFSYILDNYRLDSDTILNILKREDYSDDAALFVKLIVDKYYDKIKDELPDIYKKIVDKMIIKVDHYNILVYLSQLEIIKKKYRI